MKRLYTVSVFIAFEAFLYQKALHFATLWLLPESHFQRDSAIIKLLLEKVMFALQSV